MRLDGTGAVGAERSFRDAAQSLFGDARATVGAEAVLAAFDALERIPDPGEVVSRMSERLFAARLQDR